MKYLVALLLLVAYAVPTFGGQTSRRLQGSVRDSNGMPIKGADVVLLDSAGVELLTPKTTTDAKGIYRFPQIPSGAYSVKATTPGFKAVVTIPREGQVDLTIEPVDPPTYYSQTVTSASRLPESLLMTSASVTLLSGRDIEALGANNFAGLLQQVPGLNIAQFSARDIEINSRASTGILSNSMLVLVDGRSFVQPFYGAIYWDLMTTTTDEIKQIEVVRTPASALWGANALGGVVDIQTKSPRDVDMQGLRGSVGFGDRGTRTADVTWADFTDRLSYKLSASYFEQDAWDRDNLLPNGSPMPPSVVFENRGAKQPKFDARIDWDGDSTKVWSLRGGLTGAYGLTHSALGPGEFSPGSYSSYLQLGRTATDTDFKVYWNRLNAPYRIVLFGLDENAVNDSFAVEVTHRQKLGDRQALAYGATSNLDRFDVTIAPAERHRLNGGAFVEDRVQLGAATTLVAGGRVDKFDTTKAVFAPRVALTFSPKRTHSIRVAYNRAYRAPSLLENFVDLSIPSAVPLNPPFYFLQQVLGSTNLEMERQDAFELGYTAFFKKLTVFATVYDQTVTNKIWFLPTAFYGPGLPPPGWPLDPGLVPLLPQTYSFVNLGSVRDRGVELSARLQWRPLLFLQGSYTFQADPLLDANSSLLLQINRPARHQVSSGLTYTSTPTSPRWTVSADAHYTDKAFWADVFTPEFWGYTDSYVNVNTRVSYQPKGVPWGLWVSATNLLDQKIKSHVYGDIVRRQVTAGVRWAIPR
jgi:iron complex outermembrane receptor protein